MNHRFKGYSCRSKACLRGKYSLSKFSIFVFVDVVKALLCCRFYSYFHLPTTFVDLVSSKMHPGVRENLVDLFEKAGHELVGCRFNRVDRPIFRKHLTLSRFPTFSQHLWMCQAPRLRVTYQDRKSGMCQRSFLVHELFQTFLLIAFVRKISPQA